MWNLVVEIKIWGHERVGIKKKTGGWVGFTRWNGKN
jgi:hypothetical protein